MQIGRGIACERVCGDRLHWTGVDLTDFLAEEQSSRVVDTFVRCGTRGYEVLRFV